MNRPGRLAIITLLVAGGVLGGTVPSTLAAPAHHLPAEPLAGSILPGQMVYELGAEAVPELAALSAPAPAHEALMPQLATGCYISPSTGHYAKGTCPGYSGSGSRGFQLRARAWNGCNTFVYLYGSQGVAGSRSSYIPSSGPGTFLPFPWVIVVSWIVKTQP